MEAVSLGLIVGNRGFFPDHFCEAGRQTVLKVLEVSHIRTMASAPGDMKSGSVGSLNTACVAGGEPIEDPMTKPGGYGVAQIPSLQTCLRHICENGFEHHVAIHISQLAAAVDEALSKYLGWDVYYHK